jgi:hypothetical protein
LIVLTRLVTEGLALLKMQSFRCFQIIQGISNDVRDFRPLRIGVTVFNLALFHQSNSDASVVGEAQVMRVHVKILCQTCLHSMIRWFIDSNTWSTGSILGCVGVRDFQGGRWSSSDQGWQAN